MVRGNDWSLRTDEERVRLMKKMEKAADEGADVRFTKSREGYKVIELKPSLIKA